MKQACILVIAVMCLMFASLSYAGPLEDLENQGLLRVSTDGDSVMLYIETLLYKQMTYQQKAGMCGIAMKQYNATNVYGFKMGATGAFDMLFAFDKDKGFRVYR